MRLIHLARGHPPGWAETAMMTAGPTGRRVPGRSTKRSAPGPGRPCPATAQRTPGSLSAVRWAPPRAGTRLVTRRLADVVVAGPAASKLPKSSPGDTDMNTLSECDRRGGDYVQRLAAALPPRANTRDNCLDPFRQTASATRRASKGRFTLGGWPSTVGARLPGSIEDRGHPRQPRRDRPRRATPASAKAKPATPFSLGAARASRLVVPCCGRRGPGRAAARTPPCADSQAAIVPATNGGCRASAADSTRGRLARRGLVGAKPRAARGRTGLVAETPRLARSRRRAEQRQGLPRRQAAHHTLASQGLAAGESREPSPPTVGLVGTAQLSL